MNFAPSVSSAELAHLVAESGARALDSHALAARLERQATEGIEPDILLAIRDEARERISIQEETSKPSPLRGLEHLPRVAVVGRAAILTHASAPVDYAWQDIGVCGTIVLIAGAPGGGKTTLLFLLLIARANRGEPLCLLGRRVEPVPDGRYIVLIEGEHADGSACRKLVKSAQLLGVADVALDRIILLARKAVRLGSPEWDDVVRLVSAGLVSDIAIDTVARVMPADSSSEQEQVAVFDLVAQAIDTAPTAKDRPIVWAIAHTRKNGATGELTDVSGSTQRVGQADTVLLLKAEREGGRVTRTGVVFAKLREDPDDYPKPGSFSIGADEGGVFVVRWAEDGAPVEDEAPDDRPLEQRILSELHKGPQTKSALRDRLKSRTDKTEEAISNLFGSRSICTVDVMMAGRTRKAFALAELRRERPQA